MKTVIAFLAEDLVIVPIALVVVVITRELAGGNRRIIIEAIVAGLLALLLKVILEHYFPSTRPYILQHIPALIAHPPTTNSFPSGHTIAAFVAAFVLFNKNRRWGIMAMVAGLLVGFGRVAAHVHRPVDILGGIIVALVTVAAGHWLVGRFTNFPDMPSGPANR